MALTIKEKWDSSTGSIGQNAEDTLTAMVYGDPVTDNADDPRTVMLFAAANFPLTSPGGNTLSGIARQQRLAKGWWLFTGNYKSPSASPQTGEAKFSFRNGSQSQKIYCARKHVADYAPAGQTPPNFHGAINATSDGVEGLDIDLEAFGFDVTFYVDQRNMTTDYCALLKTLKKHVNSQSVAINIDGISMTFAAGELRFLESSGSKRIGFGDLELSLSFAASENKTDIMVGGSGGTGTGTGTGAEGSGPIGPITKKGWDYLWVRFRNELDPGAKAMAMRPLSAHVEEVFLYADLNPLFGTGGQGPDGGTGTGTGTGTSRPSWTYQLAPGDPIGG